MRRWDRLLDAYIEECRALGVSPECVRMINGRLERWGRWLKQRRPRVGIARIDADVITAIRRHFILSNTCPRGRLTACVRSTVPGNPDEWKVHTQKDRLYL
jgi:hypothetical protein